MLPKANKSPCKSFFILKFFFPCLNKKQPLMCILTNLFGPASARSNEIGVVGNNWLVGWLVGWLIGWLVCNAVRKSLQISPKSDTDIFLKNGCNDFFGFWPEVGTKYEFQFKWNLFFRKNCNFEIFGLEIVKKLPKLRFFAIFSTLHH